MTTTAWTEAWVAKAVMYVDDSFVPHTVVYLVGPQFSGGAAIPIAVLHTEAILDAKAMGASIPKLWLDFLESVPTAEIPAKHEHFVEMGEKVLRSPNHLISLAVGARSSHLATVDASAIKRAIDDEITVPEAWKAMIE